MDKALPAGVGPAAMGMSHLPSRLVGVLLCAPFIGWIRHRAGLGPAHKILSLIFYQLNYR